MLEELLKDFNIQHGVPFENIKDTSGNHYLLHISNEIKIEIIPMENGGVFFRSNLFLFLLPDKETVYRHLLEANFLYQSTLDTTLGIDPNEKYVTISKYIYTPVDKILLWESLEQFCNAWDYLKHNFEKKSWFLIDYRLG